MPAPAMKFSSAFFFLFIFLTSLVISTSARDPTYLYHFCPNTSTFTPNATYNSNLNSLLSSLSAANATYDAGFFNATAGQTPNRVYGLFLCRGDLDTQTCRDCVTFAVADTVQRCPVEKQTVIWYDQCMLRYSNNSIFSVGTTIPSVRMWNSMNVTNQQDRFSKLVVSTLNDSAAMAAAAPAGAKKFATKKENFTAINTLHTLAQCTPDLSMQDCSDCLQLVVNRLKNCCSSDQGARVLTPSCNARFEIYPFYRENLSLSPASAPVFPPSPQPPSSGKSNQTTLIVAIVAPIFVSVLLFVMGYCLLVRRSRKKQNTAGTGDAGSEITTVESLQFDLGTIEAATNKFSEVNKLGEGGFGEVYKGTLPNGQEIAVKRLSRSSSQGAEEFKNEVLVVAKLQHRNLVRLLGFCLEGEEKILVYEFVPNKSLDYFVYEPEKQRQLDWSRRYKIISGIGRGIVYLHEESRLRIIHRDLKASNVLLDADMNPKISDFGMARIFGVDQTQGNTSRVVGTYGYMSPEYAMHGQFSVKSDIYSFGVLVLEIISGKKNSSFYEKDGAGDLLSYAWKLWRDGTPLELLDETLGDSYSKNEVIRCIHIGLLCVQEDPADRPTMATILLMLNSYSTTLPSPGQPAFFVPSGVDSETGMKMMYSGQSATQSSPSQLQSINEVSISELLPR